MVLHFAIKEENAKQEHDLTCLNLIDLIGRNCHRIVVDGTMNDKYASYLAEFFRKPEYMVQTALFLTSIVHNSAKFIIEACRAPSIPETIADDLPKEDRYVVGAALISHPTIVTDEAKLRERINRHRDQLGLTAISPVEALELAKDT
jgi:hypothetical protein